MRNSDFILFECFVIPNKQQQENPWPYNSQYTLDPKITEGSDQEEGGHRAALKRHDGAIGRVCNPDQSKIPEKLHKAMQIIIESVYIVHAIIIGCKHCNLIIGCIKIVY